MATAAQTDNASNKRVSSIALGDGKQVSTIYEELEGEQLKKLPKNLLPDSVPKVESTSGFSLKSLFSPKPAENVAAGVSVSDESGKIIEVGGYKENKPGKPITVTKAIIYSEGAPIAKLDLKPPMQITFNKNGGIDDDSILKLEELAAKYRNLEKQREQLKTEEHSINGGKKESGQHPIYYQGDETDNLANIKTPATPADKSNSMSKA